MFESIAPNQSRTGFYQTSSVACHLKANCYIVYIVQQKANKSKERRSMFSSWRVCNTLSMQALYSYGFHFVFFFSLSLFYTFIHSLARDFALSVYFRFCCEMKLLAISYSHYQKLSGLQFCSHTHTPPPQPSSSAVPT